MVKARPLFVGGTSSNAGKSWMATAICAHLRRKGVSVAPFKAQNMSNNSYPCRSGGEIGRAQVAQAEACGLEPESAMNPILLKPSGHGTSQVVVDGRVWKTLSSQADSRQTSFRGAVRTAVGQVGCPAAAQAANSSGVATGHRSTQQRKGPNHHN